MIKQGSIAQNAALTVLFQAISALATIALGIGIARVDGPLGRGIWAYATVSFGMFAVFADGAFNAVLAQYKTDALPGALVYRAMLRVTAWASFALGGTAALCAAFVPGQEILLAAALALPCALYTGTATAFLAADGRVQEANAVNAVNGIGTATVALPLLVFFRASVATVLAVWVGSYAVAALSTFFLTRRYARGTFDVRALGDTAGKQLRFALASGAVFFVTYLNKRVDIFIVGILRGPVALGWYSLAVAAGEVLWRWSEALNWASFGSIAGQTPERGAVLTAQLTRTIFLLQGVCVTVLFVIAPWLIPAVWGEKFLPSVAALRMLIPGILAYSLETSLGFFIMVRLKRPTTNLLIQSCSMLACAALTLLLLPRYGLPGAAAATSITYAAVATVCAAIFLRVTRMPAARLLLPAWDDLKSLASKREA